MRVLHIVSTFDRGGIATSLWQILPLLNQRPNMQIEVAVLYEVGHYGDLLVQAGIPIHHLRLAHKYDPRGLLRLVTLLRRGSYDSVHAHGWPVVLFVAAASLLAPDAHYLLSEHNVHNRRRQYGILKAVEKFLYGRFHHIIAVSQAAANALTSWRPETGSKITVIYNGVATNNLNTPPMERRAIRAALGVTDDQWLILAAGSLERRKGLDTLIDALAQLHLFLDQDKEIDAEKSDAFPMTLIAGEGLLHSSLQLLIQEARLSDQIRLLGFRADLPALMTAVDLFVLPSRWEGCPMVILEAMAAGLPVVATAVGGVPELIVDGKSGLLVPAEDSQALASAVAQLLLNPALAHRLGQAARKRFETTFLAERSVGQMETVYRRCQVEN